MPKRAIGAADDQQLVRMASASVKGCARRWRILPDMSATVVVEPHESDTLRALLRKLSPALEHAKVRLHLNLEEYGFARPRHLVVIAAFVQWLRHEKRLDRLEVTRPLENEVDTYVSRLDFYRVVGVPRREAFRRRRSDGRFVEITRVSEKSHDAALEKVYEVVKNNFDVPPGTLHGINYALMEVLWNIPAHAQSPVDGWVTAQNYRDRVELCIVDCGRGVASSLKDNPAYASSSPEEALGLAIRKGVTRSTDRSDGQGNGLFYTSELIRCNGGIFELISGDHCLKIDHGRQNLLPSAPWNGTLTSITFYKNSNLTDDSIKVLFDKDLGVYVKEALDGLW